MKTITIVPEAELVQRLAARDEQAMAVFYRQYHRALYAAILRLVRQPEVAQDVLQDCMIKIWAAFPSYDARKGRLFTWALRISSNLAIDALRQQRTRTAQVYALDQQDSATWVAPITFRPEHIGVREWLTQLPPRDHALLDLLYLQGYTQVEAADALHLPLGTVKSRVTRSLRQLATVMT
jgi:RNA polymerase sigma factor (sigma-70 family)